ncbi:LysR family transcriptional regulator [Yoonia sediminilitoris]|uniref:DNA-binding transcriptional LysR family regulator n=1 Tax=Yoonia sediminilitoris TaxID=1286148 RepID=A0A2T6KKF9_9RHOB|nr:LysR family transcriptional regulator [Yoonia sediminilitoris]PUB16412.1 DNA-binding transcriptional LysR family regulator [Yoonia sediminilitoris]RCW96761.1 DNA-binding transcriptional LysR family regulator [Yoonia sediminilitoris]
MDKLSVMKAFCRIVERGSFSRAADDLGVSAALLSREVKLLEESLGTTLLTRTTRSMSLTDHGRRFYDEARDIVEAVARVEDGIRESASTVSGPLKIGCSNSFGQAIIGPMLPGFLSEYPDVRVTLALEERVVDVVEEGIDLTLRVGAVLQDSSLIARKIGTFHQRLFASPAYLAKHGTPQSPDEIAGHRIAGFLLADHLLEWALTGPQSTETISVDPDLKISNSIVLSEILAAGYGIGPLPSFVSKGPEARGELMRVLPDYTLPTRDIYAVTGSRLGMDARVLAFIDHLRGALAV